MPRPRPDTSVVKRCYRCKQTKPREQFYPAKDTYDRLQGTCKTCQIEQVRLWRQKDPSKHQKYNRAWAKRNHRSIRNTWMKRRYGVTSDEYDALLAAQHGKCAICGGTEPGGNGKFFHVDHCHDTGTVRGLLCNSCNLAIGHLKHSEVILQAAIAYLKSR